MAIRKSGNAVLKAALNTPAVSSCYMSLTGNTRNEHIVRLKKQRGQNSVLTSHGQRHTLVVTTKAALGITSPTITHSGAKGQNFILLCQLSLLSAWIKACSFLQGMYQSGLQANSASAQWVAENTKPCGNCKAPFFKRSGCNHLVCGNCKKHLCNKCAATFETSSETYQHLRAAHNGCYD
ncbi:hypothetical protein DUNSADRAFT_14527 [Dunaliella salina]|uniref:C2H2-type domain-containing protein n=1 Tax=Dunaliella salina TaxID=3046 RepID=A0ABQ7G798_DUNSA|nr:hypothetical protein DUNSADRAFT_14527 [Dunaliella salina]KAF5830487.1 hypothetical protein DUNSADRAFT_14527 [Dunaliella salina]|eukprot:KAF5830486.1 hypothetical protein DUNSADRAFT_14527 [Dunaliella salina]